MRLIKNHPVLLAASLFFVLLMGVIVPTFAQQGGIPAVAEVNANLRNGPGSGYPITTSVAAGTPLSVLARSADSGWLLAVTSTGKRGWVAVHQISFTQATNVA